MHAASHQANILQWVHDVLMCHILLASVNMMQQHGMVKQTKAVEPVVRYNLGQVRKQQMVTAGCFQAKSRVLICNDQFANTRLKCWLETATTGITIILTTIINKGDVYAFCPVQHKMH